jgi:hypothetical protein
MYPMQSGMEHSLQFLSGPLAAAKDIFAPSALARQTQSKSHPTQTLQMCLYELHPSRITVMLNFIGR